MPHQTGPTSAAGKAAACANATVHNGCSERLIIEGERLRLELARRKLERQLAKKPARAHLVPAQPASPIRSVKYAVSSPLTPGDNRPTYPNLTLRIEKSRGRHAVKSMGK